MAFFRFIYPKLTPTPVNQPPQWSPVDPRTVAYGGATSSVAGFVSDEGAVSFSTFSGGSGDEAVVWPSYLTLSPAGVITALATAPVGSVTVRVRATDSQGESSVSAPFTVNVVKGLNRAPVWQTPLPTFTRTVGGTIDCGAYYSDLDMDAPAFTPIGALPSGFALNQNTGQVSIDLGVTPAAYSFRLRVSDGVLTADSQPFVVTVQAIVTTPLTITQVENIKLDTLNPQAGYGLWNMGHFDRRGGFVMWGRSDHGDGQAGGLHSVRYFNCGTEVFAGIAPGQIGYLVPQQPSQGAAKVADYDNLQWFYVASEDKFFWLPDGNTVPGNRNGIFDFQLQPPGWAYGNSGINGAHWSPGSYWNDFVANLTTNGGVYNLPTAYSEAADAAIQLFNVPNGSVNSAVLFWDRNPNHPLSDTRPWRMRYMNMGNAQATPWQCVRRIDTPRPAIRIAASTRSSPIAAWRLGSGSTL
ncbi:MAG: hypothetical protein KIS91_02045 [Anaerolineae bacterium]|nr:hypothetical protein [Anaerolineae bacterium]